MVPVSLTTLLVAILSVSVAKKSGRKNQANRNVEAVCKPVKKADLFKVSLTPMTSLMWLRIAANSNRQALRLLATLNGKQSLPHTMLENAQKMIQPGSEHTLHVTTALTYETQSLSTLLNLTATWNSEHKQVAKHLVSAVASLVLGAELKKPAPNKENQIAALALFDEEEQPETAQKAVSLAEKVQSEIAKTLPSFNMPPLLRTA